MATTYEIISKSVLSSNQSSVSLTAIPNTYTDLLVKITSRTAATDVRDSITIKPNNSTSSLSYRYIRADGSGLSSNTLPRVDINAANATSNTFASTEIYIPNYALSNNKSFSIDTVSENNATEAWSGLHAWLWSDSSAITSLVFVTLSGTDFVSGSSFYLYGIKNS
jgi:hypothetical protein